VKIKVINGPNLNMFGVRQPETYGATTLEQINQALARLGEELGIGSLEFFQSNIEGEIVEAIQQSHKRIDGILINPAAYGHTSIAIRDALLAVSIPFVEVHASNIYKREEFRHKTYLSDIAEGVITGFSADSYLLGLRALHTILKNKTS